MQIGVVFPQTEIGADVGAVRAYAERVEELGFAHLLAYDHVLGADPAVHRGWNGPVRRATRRSTSRSCCSATSPRSPSLELVTGIIILPQRQTALVAKQAAEVDLLTDGRFRLGVGLGWNAGRVRGARQDVHQPRPADRASRSPLLRRLWTEPTRHPRRRVRAGHRRRPRAAAGAAADPDLVRRRPRPRRYRRAGRLADGWFPQVPPGPRLDEARAIVEQAAAEAGPRSGDARHGGPGRAGAPTASTSSSTTSAGGATPAPPTCRSTRWAPASASVDAHLEVLATAAEALGLPPFSTQ